MSGMRHSIVEGEDYSVLPAPLVKLIALVRKRLGRDDEPQHDADPPERSDPGD